MKFIACYDISDPKTLNKVSNFLSKKGIRVQYSIFELDVSQKEMIEIYNHVISLLNEETDRFYIYKANKNKDKIFRKGKLSNLNII